jgi:tetratricopeptide (TPR) repeat protein
MSIGTLFLKAVVLTGASALVSTAGHAFELTVPALDAAWENRNNLCQEYVDLGLKKPKLGKDYDVLWRAGRAIYFGGCFCWEKVRGKDAPNGDLVAFYEYGVNLLEKAREAAPNRVEGHYWYGTSYGLYGMAKGIFSALKGAKVMREALTRAIEIDPGYHFGGPYRIRGRLYASVPGGFISFGDKKKALEDLLKARELGPQNKLNYVYLAEVQASETTREEAKKTLAVAEKLGDMSKEVGLFEEQGYLRDIERVKRDLK